MNRMQRNKVFQAALAKKRDREDRENRSYQLPADAPSSPIVATKRGASSHSLTQRTQTPPASSEARVVESAPPLHRPLNRTPAMPHTPLATFSSLAHSTASSDSAAKRPRMEQMSPHQERLAERVPTFGSERNTPATDRKTQSTPSTQSRPSNLPLKQVQDPSYNRPVHASPHSESSLRQNISSAVQTHSPPTPPRYTPRLPTSASSVRSLNMMHQHSPLNHRSSLHQHSPLNRRSSLQEWIATSASASLSVYGSSSSQITSGPPPNEPTPFCSAPSNQQTWPHATSSGFHNDGNTCYLRCHCSCSPPLMWTSLLSAVLHWSSCSARPPS